MSSWPILNVNGTNKEVARLKTVLGLAEHNTAKGYAISKNRIVFFWVDHKDMVPFPAPLSMDRCAEIALDWLATAPYDKEPDHDGDNEKGWRAFTESWGHVEPYGWSAFVAVETHWIMYGK